MRLHNLGVSAFWQCAVRSSFPGAGLRVNESDPKAQNWLRGQPFLTSHLASQPPVSWGRGGVDRGGGESGPLTRGSGTHHTAQHHPYTRNFKGQDWWGWVDGWYDCLLQHTVHN